jgi:hypothetical protein
MIELIRIHHRDTGPMILGNGLAAINEAPTDANTNEPVSFFKKNKISEIMRNADPMDLPNFVGSIDAEVFISFLSS